MTTEPALGLATSEADSASATVVDAPSERSSSSAVEHPALNALIRLRQTGDVLRAQQGFDRFAAALERQPVSRAPEVEALWLEATRLWFESALESGQVDLALEGIRRRFERFQQPVWTELKQSTASFYQDMIRLSIATGLDEQAFELFQTARNHVQLSPDLRVQLLEIAHRLNRVDSATARLCIEELTTGARPDDEQTARLFEILRRAIRITPDEPADELLTEFRALNLQTWETATQSWAVGHLAIADWRLRRPLEARRWCELRHSRNDLAETDLLIGSVGYLLHDWTIARERFLWALGKDAPELHPVAMALQQLEVLNGLLERRGGGQSLDAFQRSVAEALAELQGWERHDGWRLDADWVIGSALTALGQSEPAATCFRKAPLVLARWRHAWTAWQVWQHHAAPDEVNAWLESLTAAQPVVALCLKAWGLILALQFEEARRTLASLASVHDEVLQHDSELKAVLTCLKAELAFAGSDPTPELPAAVLPAFQEWNDQLHLRRRLERGELKAARDISASTTQHTADQHRWTQLTCALSAAAAEPADDLAGQFFALLERSTAGPLDVLHAGLWLVKAGRHSEAEPHLTSFATQVPQCVECQLALAECALQQGRAQDAIDRVSSLNPLTNWRNQLRWAWFRPWQQLLPANAPLDGALVAAPRLADVLHAADLALKADQPELAVELLGHVEQLLGPCSPALAAEVGARFSHAAALEAQQGRWEAACRCHQAAKARGNRDNRFVEAVASSYETAASGPTEVLEVLFSWLDEFAGEESQYLATIPGRVFSRLVRIEAPAVPESDREYEHRRNWTNRFHAARPDWDEPKRSLIRSHVRQRDDAAAVAIGESLRQPTEADQRLLARALWNLGRFREAASAFAAGGERAWGGCARAAELFQQMAVEARWLAEAQATSLLEELAAETDGGEQPPQLRLWTGAVLVACGQGEAALPHLLAAETSDPDLQSDRKILVGLAQLQAEQWEQAEQTWGPPLPLAELLKTPERLVDWNRLEACLWLLCRLQRPGERELPVLGKLIQQLRKLGERSDLFRTGLAELALRVGDLAVATEAAESLSQADPLPPREILRSPLQCLRRDEREFVQARMQMQSHQFAEAETRLAEAGRRPLWKRRSRYWQALCLVHRGDTASGDAQLEVLQRECPNDPAIPAQRAQLRLSAGETDAANDLARAALAIDELHGFALLVQANVHERRGDVAAAAGALHNISALPQWQVHRRVRTAAELALGRLALAHGEVRTALKHFRSAHKWSLESAIAGRRLGILLAVCAESPDEFREADTLLSQAAETSPNDLFAALALVVTADRLDDTAAVAKRLERLVSLPQFAALPAGARRELAILSADTQLRRQRYAAAATALEQLLAEAPDEEILERLRRCRLLQALQVLGQRPLPSDAFEQIRTAAETVCSGPRPPAVAVLLRALARLFTGECSTPEARAAAIAEVQACSGGNRDEQWLAAIVRYWLGDETAGEALDSLWQQPDTAVLHRIVETVAASLQRKSAALQSEARRIVESRGSDAAGAFEPEDIVVLGALADGASKPEQAVELLKQWHAAGRTTERTKSLLSKLLAKQAVKSLKQKKFGQTRKLLGEALAAAER